MRHPKNICPLPRQGYFFARSGGVSSRTGSVLDETGLDRALTRIAHEIVEQAGCGQDVAWSASRPAGDPRERSAPNRGHRGTKPSVGALDITLYRDDLGSRPRSRGSAAPRSASR